MLFFFSALGAFNGFMIAVYFAINANKKKFTIYFLAFLLLMLSIRIIKSVFFYFNPALSNIFIQLGLSACILIGPFLYLYIKSQLSNETIKWGIHTLPYVIGITVLGLDVYKRQAYDIEYFRLLHDKAYLAGIVIFATVVSLQPVLLVTINLMV